ncbi:MAG: 3-hydroxybutyryl-CoA dehydrogenase [Planctomycetes bacterium]|nr:3-hydroxybutyryl-CoA dehydrogenase [Planctomycetota bacterium]
MSLPKKVAVIGAGTMGNGIAQVFASHGVQTVLCDVNDGAVQRGIDAIGKSLDRFVKKGTLSDAQKAETLARISKNTDVESACFGIDLMVEAVFENLDVKREIFKKADRGAPPHAILATNTSSISVTRIGSSTKRADRVIGMHFMNPVPLMKLVEVIRGHATSEETTAWVMGASEALGKVPVAAQDYPGFISNRVLLPMINEAAFCLMEGVATREGIDEIMKLGMNHPMGPLQLADFIGLDVCVNILDVLKDGLGDDKYRACPLLRRMVAAGYLGRKSGRGFYEYTT